MKPFRARRPCLVCPCRHSHCQNSRPRLALFTRSTQTFPGAAQTWFVVNIPETVAGISETMSARSRFLPFCEPLPVPRRLMSQKTPPARKPFGAMIEPGISLNIFSILMPRAEICGLRRGFSNFYRVNFQSHHFNMDLPARVRWMFSSVAFHDGGDEFLAQIFRHALR